MSKHPDDLSHKEKLRLLRALRDAVAKHYKVIDDDFDGVLHHPIFDARQPGCEPLNIFLHKRKLARKTKR